MQRGWASQTRGRSTDRGRAGLRYNRAGGRCVGVDEGDQRAMEPRTMAATETRPAAPMATGRDAAPGLAVGEAVAAAAGSVTPAGSEDGMAMSAPESSAER